MTSSRLYHCARCQCQVVICSDCDRGNIYCGTTCSQLARATNHRIANQLYQATLRGKQNNAARQRRYRERRKNNVTDQGSIDLPSNDSLPDKPGEGQAQQVGSMICHFCRAVVSPFLRHGYIRHHEEDRLRFISSWPLAP